MDASTLHPECTLGRQTPVCRQLGHEAAFRPDQGLRTRHGHRRLGNVVLSASLSGGRQWPTTVCCGHLSQMDTPHVLNGPSRTTRVQALPISETQGLTCRWAYLPTEFYSVGAQTGRIWKPGTPVNVPENVVMHHAN